MVMALAEEAEVNVLKYERIQKGYFYNHKAIIETDSLDYVDEVEVVKATSSKVGFDTSVFGLSKHSIQEHPTRDCYLVKWETEMYEI